MGHINYNLDYMENSLLFKSIKAKHDADLLLPTGSVLTPYLNEQSINLGNDLILVVAADAAHELFKVLDKLSEDKREKRDNIINPAFEQHRGMVQFMKRLKRGKVHELGDWGVTVSNIDRIDYPEDFLSLRLAIKAFIDKHNTFPAGTSPLQPYLNEHPEIDLVQTLADLATSLTLHTEFDQANKDAEEQRELRDTKFAMPYQHILGIGQYLMGLFADNPHNLGAWGYIIDDHTRVRTKEYTLEAAQKIDLKKLNVGSKVFVLSDGEVSITASTKIPNFKGGRGVANKQNPYTLSYGNGNSTIENTSTTSQVTFTVQFHY